MKKYAIKFSYDGKNYSGWQEQKNKTTVQSVMEIALAKIFGEKVKLYASGRTDAGVSALGQVAHFSTGKEFPRGFVGYINSLLPEDIRVLKGQMVDDQFHARYDVSKKTYVYKMYCSDYDIPLYGNALRIPSKIDVKKMREEMKELEGDHDFSAFCASDTEVMDKTRTIYSVSLRKSGEFLEFSVTGNGFLYNMVRILVGTLIDIGMGKKSNMAQIIASKDRKMAGKTVSAKGLVLKNVEYDKVKF